ncbi:MAG: hypothetical protein IJZ53_11110 [Tyzzerella sp.]|nr:hypothetical protein [Tyzzerella sp.]
MANKSKLQELEDKILFGDFTDEEWKAIDKEVDEEFQKASEEERKAFIKSGAGDFLATVMEYMD